MNGAIVSSRPSPLWMRMVFGRNPRVTLIRLGSLVIVSVVLFRFVLIPIRVSGLSMHPTYRHGRINLVNHLAYRWKNPQRGDVVAFRSPEEDNIVLLKRVVGLPGERVRVAGGRIYINGDLLDEPYAKLGKIPPALRTRTVTLEEDEYFMIGDNRSISIITRVQRHLILGKVLF